MPIDLPALPYDRTALEPHLSGDAVERHHAGHHRAHVDALNAMIAGTAFAELALEEIVRKAQGAMAEHAAQAWSTGLYWRCLKPAAAGGGGEPEGRLAEALATAFGSVDAFRTQFDEAALRGFGSGWAWLLRRDDGRLAIAVTPHAVTPLTGPDTPLLACCLWEHAYLPDYGENRGKYLEAFWKLVDWEFVASRL
ncbi:superoxide dismutase [Luteimonas sp. SJ-92]|uniref:Superoxide dismutase n=1 Tax=Luteimonas salinisoli TaxID=2752307 RepID=A0A853JAR4_9GAMM|nr:Fe-Mn family superoxide dismutase [Luteimonas salinisoli]NZA26293.1 superoxide dismutase [Luteimonas salinisoli]